VATWHWPWQSCHQCRHSCSPHSCTHTFTNAEPDTEPHSYTFTNTHIALTDDIAHTFTNTCTDDPLAHKLAYHRAPDSRANHFNTIAALHSVCMEYVG
jgi:hypothetical protein